MYLSNWGFNLIVQIFLKRFGPTDKANIEKKKKKILNL